MDIRVERLGNGHLQTSVYRKPTHTGRYLNFESNHPPSVKRSVVKSLISRTEYVSRNDGKEEEAHKITVDLLANNYPRNFIRQQEQRKQSRHTQATRSTETVKASACERAARGQGMTAVHPADEGLEPRSPMHLCTKTKNGSYMIWPELAYRMHLNFDPAFSCSRTHWKVFERKILATSNEKVGMYRE